MWNLQRGILSYCLCHVTGFKAHLKVMHVPVVVGFALSYLCSYVEDPNGSWSSESDFVPSVNKITLPLFVVFFPPCSALIVLQKASLIRPLRLTLVSHTRTLLLFGVVCTHNSMCVPTEINYKTQEPNICCVPFFLFFIFFFPHKTFSMQHSI